MSEIRNIVRDVKSGALPKDDYLPFVLFLLRRGWLVVAGILGALAFLLLGPGAGYPIKPEIYAKLPKAAPRRRSFPWRSVGAVGLLVPVIVTLLLIFAR